MSNILRHSFNLFGIPQSIFSASLPGLFNSMPIPVILKSLLGVNYFRK